jgi:hypothetical protein
MLAGGAQAPDRRERDPRNEPAEKRSKDDPRNTDAAENERKLVPAIWLKPDALPLDDYGSGACVLRPEGQ